MRIFFYCLSIFFVFLLCGFVDIYFELSKNSPVIGNLVVSSIAALGIVVPGTLLLKNKYETDSQERLKENLSDKTRDSRAGITETIIGMDSKIDTIIMSLSMTKKDLLKNCFSLSRTVKMLKDDWKSLSKLIEGDVK